MNKEKRCPNNCNVKMIHLKGIHTYQCPSCGYKEWYPERLGDK